MTSEHSTVNGTGPPTSEDVAEILRARITSGDLKPGRPIPTQKALVEEFGVQRGVIRQALRHLQEDGLLTEVTRGAPPRIAGRAGLSEPVGSGIPQETMVALRPRITEAFQADDVRIDALCLTAESLTAALGEQRLLLQERERVPATVKLRVLLPNRDIDLAFPRPVGKPGSDADEGGLVHHRWLTQRNSHGRVLSDHLMGIHEARGVDVDVQFRALPFTPPVKLYLLNGAEALFAYYEVHVREVEFGPTEVEMYDARGDKSPLFSFVAGPGGPRRDDAFVAQSQVWFDALWETIATDLTLG